MEADRLMPRKPPSFEAAARGRAKQRLGRLQRGILRAFMASEQRGLPTSAFMQWCYPRQRGRHPYWQRGNVWRACRLLGAVRVNGRDRREALWRLRD
jgi:hypothetical protein